MSETQKGDRKDPGSQVNALVCTRVINFVGLDMHINLLDFRVSTGFEVTATTHQ